MSFLRDLEQILFFYGFRECKKKKNLNFLKINETEYLLLKIFKQDTADLFYAKYEHDSDPCLSEPAWEKVVKLSFMPGVDDHFLKSYL